MTNSRFAAIWALLIPVITGAVLLVEPLGIAHWTGAQTALVTAEANTFSGFVLAAMAYFWPGTTREPATLAAALSAFLLATFALGNGFVWWMLSDNAQQLILGFAGSVLALILGLLVRQSVVPAPKPIVGDVIGTPPQ